MEARPEGIGDDTLTQALAGGWAFEATSVEYVPVGFGSYHWVAGDGTGDRRFVTVDDLDQKLWLGESREERFAGLRGAFDTAAALREAGLEAVVAPLRARDGGTLHELGARHTVALFPFVEGRSARWGRYEDDGERAAVLELLAALHDGTPHAGGVARRHSLAVPGGGTLERALAEADSPWRGGPFSEPTRRALAQHAAALAGAMVQFDRQAARVGGDASWVVSHGEPHAANVIRTEGGLRLVDWDTVALAPLERDLWLVVDSPAQAAAYTDATGRRVDADALDLFRAAWDLGDLAEYVSLFRSSHGENADTAKAFGGVTATLERIAAAG